MHLKYSLTECQNGSSFLPKIFFLKFSYYIIETHTHIREKREGEDRKYKKEEENEKERRENLGGNGKKRRTGRDLGKSRFAQKKKQTGKRDSHNRGTKIQGVGGILLLVGLFFFQPSKSLHKNQL